MMITDPKIIILGTSHHLQCGTNKHTNAQIQEFKDLLRKICKIEKIKSIMEEMSSEGLENYKVDNTIAFEIAADLKLDHSYTDLNSKQYTELGISEIQIVNIATKQRNNYDINAMVKLLSDKILHPIRERLWLIDILSKNIWPTLFICGSEHGQAMQDLINSIGYGPLISWVKCCPEEIEVK